jgi:hypothetical protein
MKNMIKKNARLLVINRNAPWYFHFSHPNQSLEVGLFAYGLLEKMFVKMVNSCKNVFVSILVV